MGSSKPADFRKAKPTLSSNQEKCGFLHLSNISFEEYCALARSLGPLMPQQDGVEFYDVKAREGYEDRRYSGSCNPIGPHTEFPYLASPPRYLGLFCIQPARGEGGATFLADFEEMLGRLTLDERKQLERTQFEFASAVFSNGEHITRASYPVLSVSGDRRLLRYSHNYFAFGDTDAKMAADNERSTSFFGEHPEVGKINILFDGLKQTFRLRESECLIWDNHRMLHAREGYSDSGRWLKRFVV